MRPGPSRWLQKVVGLLIPPACREEVLGDLHERYKGPGQYLADALRTMPLLIWSRIRRTTDLQLLLTEALLFYAAFLSAAWYVDRTLIGSAWIPAVVAFIVLLLDDVWTTAGKRSRQGVAIATACACFSQAVVLPVWINLFTGGISLLLVSAVRIFVAFVVGKGEPR
jgi:hypothetical protein